ncbi:LPS export ABC transporter periplasmic protein LptC [Algicola sagamiensis]|uniref:LPS export ABC transporter periplasmic protein LptC n=1 Tax=Algicola sagamiensis TaxID=163869 RepID=UPI00035CB8FC|nr:LPS export ABC transporter periplasmic protein LptC [Algicola sagamiensis]
MKRIIGICVLVALIIGGIWFFGFNLQWVKSDVTKEANTTMEKRPDFVAEDLSSTIYNVKGLPVHKVKAQRMEHYGRSGFTMFYKPEHTIFPTNKKVPWTIQAEEATYYPNEKITLEKNVVIETLDRDKRTTTIKTNYLEISLKNNTMSSTDKVVIQGSQFRISGKGFFANIEKESMEIHKHAKTVYFTNRS